MMLKLISICIAVVFVMTGWAGYVNEALLWQENFASAEALKNWKGGSCAVWMPGVGPNGEAAVKFESPKVSDRMITLTLDPARVNGLIKLEAWIKGENLQQAARGYWGTKMMLSYNDGKTSCNPEPKRPGEANYGWRKVSLVVDLARSARPAVLTIGIQQGQGTYYVAGLTIHRCVEKETAAQAAPVNKEALTIPRGDFTGTQYRGVMSGNQLEDADFATLQQWGVNLMRFQLAPHGRDISSPEKYLAWINDEIKRIDAKLALAKK